MKPSGKQKSARLGGAKPGQLPLKLVNVPEHA